MSRHVVEGLLPELHGPHFWDVCLRGIGRIRVSRGAQVQRKVKLNAALGDMRLMFRVDKGHANSNVLGNFKPTIHRAHWVCSDDLCFVLSINFDLVALRFC